MEHLTKFKSSNVQSATYDPTTRELIVTFKGGQGYRYPKIMPETWQAFQKADSKGGFVRKHISAHHKGVKLDVD